MLRGFKINTKLCKHTLTSPISKSCFLLLDCSQELGCLQSCLVLVASRAQSSYARDDACKNMRVCLSPIDYVFAQILLLLTSTKARAWLKIVISLSHHALQLYHHHEARRSHISLRQRLRLRARHLRRYVTPFPFEAGLIKLDSFSLVVVRLRTILAWCTEAILNLNIAHSSYPRASHWEQNCCVSKMIGT